jgi:hypothetical protein
MTHPILEELAKSIGEDNYAGRTYEVMQEATGVNRATLCRLAQRKVPLLSVELASRIAPAFGYELRLVKRRKYDKA